MASVQDVSQCFTNGRVLCSLINRWAAHSTVLYIATKANNKYFFHSYRPELIDLDELNNKSAIECNELAFSIIEREFGIPRAMSPNDSAKLESVDSKIWLSYLEQICEVFRGEIPHVMHPQMDIENLRETKRNIPAPDFSRLLKYNPGHSRKTISPNKEPHFELPCRIRKSESPAAKQAGISNLDIHSRRTRKRRSHEKSTNFVRMKIIPIEITIKFSNTKRISRTKNLCSIYQNLLQSGLRRGFS